MANKKKILFIAPLPPPVTGQSVISDALYRYWNISHEIFVINYARKSIKQSSIFVFSQIREAFRLRGLIKKVITKHEIDLVYFTISQSPLGNLKDLLFLNALKKNGRRKTVLHLHGGGFHLFFEKFPGIVKKIDKKYFGQCGKAIVLSSGLKKCLLPLVNIDKIEIVHNFADSEMIVSEKEFQEKWNCNRYEILYCSNFIKEKGYMELLEAFFAIDNDTRKKYRLHLAGGFPDKESEEFVINKIKGHKDIIYHGIIEGNKKKELFNKSHIFILPTYYQVEGQPISIIEAYMAGMVVCTTEQGGIPDIFLEETNGYLLEKQSTDSIVKCLREACKNKDKLIKVARNNTQLKEKYNQKLFFEQMDKVCMIK